MFKMLMRDPELEKKYPGLQKVIDHVYSVPKVKAYSESKKWRNLLLNLNYKFFCFKLYITDIDKYMLMYLDTNFLY